MNKQKRNKRAKLKAKQQNIKRNNRPKETQEGKEVYQKMLKRGNSKGSLLKQMQSYKKEVESVNYHQKHADLALEKGK